MCKMRQSLADDCTNIVQTNEKYWIEVSLFKKSKSTRNRKGSSG